jgi:hypothetical protein
MKFVDPTELRRNKFLIKPPLVLGTAGCAFCRRQEMPRFISRGPATPVTTLQEIRGDGVNPAGFLEHEVPALPGRLKVAQDVSPG